MSAARGMLVGLLLGLALPAASPALEPDPAQARASAERLATWAVEARRPALLASAIDTLLAEGATLEPDDPWDAARFVRALRAMPGGAVLATQFGRERRDSGTTDDILGALDGALVVVSRGAMMGVTRAEITLAPGERASFDLAFQAREVAIIEARLRRGPEAADVDLRVTDASGTTLAEDVGPETGRPGFGLYVEWMPPSCANAQLELANVGAGEARLVMLTEPSEQSQCVD